MLMPFLIAVHVLGVVIWIGGVTFVTIIIFPMIMKTEGSLEKMLFFQGVEHRFANIAKLCVLVVGITGAWLLTITNRWSLLFTGYGIGITLMLIVWTFYVFVLLFEGRLFKIIFKGEAQQDTSKIFFRLSVFHWVILGLSWLALFVGVLSGHGGI